MIRVFLLDDHEMVRRGLTDLLVAAGGFEVVGEASTVAEGLVSAPRCNADVAVLDIRLPDGSGIELCRELQSVAPDIACLMLTSYDDEQAVLAAAMAGARGHLLKNVKGNDLVGAIQRVARGESLLDAETVRAVMGRVLAPAADPLSALTPQERRLLSHIAEGKTNRQIATEMSLAEKTVKNYVSNVLMKLGMARRTEAAVFATRIAERRITHDT